MAESLRIRDADSLEVEDRHSYPDQHVTRPDHSGRYCVYDVSRTRFVSTEVEAADFSPVLIESRLATLTSGSEAAFWLTPYRGLPSTNFRFLIDLVTLNRNHIVLEAIESYPLARGSNSGTPAASALALPANTIASTGIRPGDQLMLGTPEEMKSLIKRIENHEPVSPVIPISGSQERNHQDSGAGASDPRVKAFGDQLYRESQEPDQAQGGNGQKNLRAGVEAPSTELDRAAIAEQLDWNNPDSAGKSKKSWWHSWIMPEPPKDPRHALRDALPGLVAYFFTGGVPMAHGIRNISASGVYVFTDERWYLGTVVRMTLTDQREQISERSITLHAKVVRWGNDGVGLQFILRHKKHPAPPKNRIPENMTRENVRQFLDLYRGQHPEG